MEYWKVFRIGPFFFFGRTKKCVTIFCVSGTLMLYRSTLQTEWRYFEIILLFISRNRQCLYLFHEAETRFFHIARNYAYWITFHGLDISLQITREIVPSSGHPHCTVVILKNLNWQFSRSKFSDKSVNLLYWSIGPMEKITVTRNYETRQKRVPP